MHTPLVPVNVFCSYAEADASFLESLEKHLSVLRYSGTIVIWHRRKVIAGSDWKHELDHHLNTASLIILLISPDFLDLDYQYGVELQQAMERYDGKQAQVIPIMLRPCDWEGAPFAKLQVLPRNGKAITLWPDRDEAFTEVAREIRALLEGKQSMTTPTSNGDSATSTYSVQINEGKGIIIGNNAQVMQTFDEP